MDFLNSQTTISVLLILIGLAFGNMLSKNLLSTLLQVRIFKRGNIVVCVSHDLEDYYVPGSLDASALTYTSRKRFDNPKAKRILAFIDKDKKPTGGYDIARRGKYRSFGCDCIMVDDNKNSIFFRHNASYESVGGYNAEAMSEKLDTALKKPPEDELGLMPPKNFQILVLIGIGLLGVGLYFVYKQVKVNDDHDKLIYDLLQQVMSRNVTGV